MGRVLFALLPLVTFVAVGVLVLWVGVARPVESIRVWGGPTDRAARFSGWIEAEVDGHPLAGQVLRLTARPEQANSVSVAQPLDAQGRAEIQFDFERPPLSFELSAALPGGTLGAGRIELPAQRWLATAGHRGGFSRLPEASALSLQIAPARGVFAVPFPGELWVRVLRQGTALVDAKVDLKADGAKLLRETAKTDGRGIARFTLTPTEHVVTARANVTASDGLRAELSFSVPVVPGAILIERRGNTLQVRSPIEREEAFVTVVSEQGRWMGARVPLVAVGDGTAQGTLEVPTLPNEPLWAVAKSDPAAPSSLSVGWPLFAGDEPAQTFDIGDRLLLDTEPTALARERDRRRGIRRLALAIGLLGAFVSALSVVVATRRGRKAARAHLSEELGPEGSAQLLPQQSVRSILSISLIILGFFAIAAIAGWRLI
ncbi:MAG TPA: hypothetical protein VG937_31730 [Polyangiaceae bacterium]|nr:hypothetical protein [Polyangiaceae bacterium]